MIGGLIVSGTKPRRVLVSGIGPDLANFGVEGVLANPSLVLLRGQNVLAAGDDWQSGDPAVVAEIRASGFAPNHPLEAAILAELAPGEYTAILHGTTADGASETGVGLVQAFDLGPVAGDDPGASRLSNLSTRLRVGSGDGVMIGGFRVEAGQRLLVRALGPTLGAVPFLVEGAMTDPELRIFGSGEAGPFFVEENLDWIDSPNADRIAATGKAPADPREPAMLLELGPGEYTAIVSGGEGGVALIEVYEED